MPYKLDNKIMSGDQNTGNKRGKKAKKKTSTIHLQTSGQNGSEDHKK